MYLIDTNVWLERLLDQDLSDEVGQRLDTIPSNQLYITDFAFHSIALILIRLEQPDSLRKYIQDLFVNGSVNLLHSTPSNIEAILDAIDKFQLDFDDAYQYVIAEQHNLTLVSLDHHFDKTTRGRKTPEQILNAMTSQDVSNAEDISDIQEEGSPPSNESDPSS